LIVYHQLERFGGRMLAEQSVDQRKFRLLAQKPVVVQSPPQPIRPFDHGWGHTRRLAACLVDRRFAPSHRYEQMARRRIDGLPAGNLCR